MKTKTSPNFAIPQKQKRLSYWESHLSKNAYQSHFILENLTTYRMLLSRLTKASSLSTKEDVEDTYHRLLDIERVIDNCFEDWLLATSPNGECNASIDPE